MSYETFFGVSRINIAIALLIQKVESKDGGSSHWQNEFKTRMWMAAWPIEATRWSSRCLSPSISDAEPKSSPVKLPVFFRRILLLHPTHFGCAGRASNATLDGPQTFTCAVTTRNFEQQTLHILQLEMETAVLKTHAKHTWWSIERQVRVHC